MLGYDKEEERTTLLRTKDISVQDCILTSQVFEIVTEMMSPDKQQTVIDTEEDEDEMDDDDEDEEMKDETFKLYKRFDKYSPSHIVRYCFSKSTKPLYYSDYDQFSPVNNTPCKSCGGPRNFEFQINAQILSLVKPLIDLDWGIVAVFSCAKSCQPAEGKYSREAVEIQIAPDEIDSHNMKRLQERKLKEFEKDMHDLGPDMLLEDEIALVKQQIKEEELEDRMAKQMSKKKQGNEEVMEEKSGKLFEEEDSDDDWA